MGWTSGEDIFGDVDGLIREQRGWLTEEVVFESPVALTFPVEGQSFQGMASQTKCKMSLFLQF